MRLIDADRLLSERAKSTYYHLKNGDIAIPIIDIEHAPTIKPEEQLRKKGEWVTYEYPDKENCFYLQCSICGKPAIWANGVSNFPPHFCPSCGAEMKNHNERISNF